MREGHPNPRDNEDRSMNREQARIYMAECLLREYRALIDPHHFSTYPTRSLIDFYLWNLRWIECAPEGAWHVCAPLCDKRGHSMGGEYRENVGPSRALREAYLKRHPDWTRWYEGHLRAAA